MYVWYCTIMYEYNVVNRIKNVISLEVFLWNVCIDMFNEMIVFFFHLVAPVLKTHKVGERKLKRESITSAYLFEVKEENVYHT